MKIIETIFDKCYLIEPDGREDSRGTMSVFFNKKEMAKLLDGFEISEQRLYRMQHKNTFFGIHYQDFHIFSLILRHITIATAWRNL